MKSILLLSLIVLIGLTGCVTSQIVSMESEGLLPKQPIRITDSSNTSGITIRGQISRSDRELASFSDNLPDGDTTSFSHFSYNVPRYQLNAEIEAILGNHFAFVAGASFGKVESKEYLGGHLGVVAFSISPTNTFRFDIGAKFQKIESEIVYTNTVNRWLQEDLVEVVKTNSKTNYTNLYAGVTLHGNKKDVFANVFFSYLLSYQTFFDYEGNIFTKGFKLMESVHSVSVGLFKNVNNFGRIILGARITHYSFDFGETSPFDMFLQYDFFL